jgi:hypothetical protein
VEPGRIGGSLARWLALLAVVAPYPLAARLARLLLGVMVSPMGVWRVAQRLGQVELFFEWIKQHLRIKAFYDASENAVKTQIWIAVSVYVLVAIVRKRLGLEASLYQILQSLSVTLFEKTPILRALQASEFENAPDDSGNQLGLFDS